MRVWRQADEVANDHFGSKWSVTIALPFVACRKQQQRAPCAHWLSLNGVISHQAGAEAVSVLTLLFDMEVGMPDVERPRAGGTICPSPADASPVAQRTRSSERALGADGAAGFD